MLRWKNLSWREQLGVRQLTVNEPKERSERIWLRHIGTWNDLGAEFVFVE